VPRVSGASEEASQEAFGASEEPPLADADREECKDQEPDAA